MSTDLIHIDRRARNIVPVTPPTRGPGRVMLQVAIYGAKVVKLVSDKIYEDPMGPYSKIAAFLGEGPERASILEQLYDGRHPPPKELRNLCHSLLKFARPDSEGVGTQIDVFRMLYSTITRYPRLRLLVCSDKDITRALATDTTLENLWRRPYEPHCGMQWEFYRNLAVFCIAKSALSEVVEGTPPSGLCRLSFVNDNQNPVPTEVLLGFCQSSPDPDIARLCAIRHLGGILELPLFWSNGAKDKERLSELLSKISRMILDLFGDTRGTGLEDGPTSELFMSAVRDAGDFLCRAVLRGVGALHRDRCLPENCPRSLFDVVLYLMRDDVKSFYPRAFPEAPQIRTILEEQESRNINAKSTPSENVEGQVRTVDKFNTCPPPSRIFLGRQRILAKMNQFFAANSGKQLIYVLYGLGGAGKTQTALKFVQDSSANFSDIFFVDASTVDMVETGLRNIAVDKGLGRSVEDASNWLQSKNENWLLLLDNADDPTINLNSFIPQCNHGNIIITSRNPELQVYGDHSSISGMEETDAINLLLRSANKESSRESLNAAVEIVKKLYYYPVAIVQAGAFIRKSGDLASYLALYQENRVHLLSERPAQTHDDYAWTVYTTWQISFNRLSKTAATFLQLCSFLDPTGISEDFFRNASSTSFPAGMPSKGELEEPLGFLAQFRGPTGEWNSLLFWHVIKELVACSLITSDPKTGMFSIHPLIHSWTRSTVDD